MGAPGYTDASRDSSIQILVQRSYSVKLNLRVAAVCLLTAGLVTPAVAQSGGAETYKTKCTMCHAPDGRGNTPAGVKLKAASFKDPAIVKATDGELIAIVNSGKNKMPPYKGKLTDKQIKEVVEFIRTLQK